MICLAMSALTGCGTTDASEAAVDDVAVGEEIDDVDKDGDDSSDESTPTDSVEYAKAMGAGWNLGNSLDAYFTDGNADLYEESWSNPKVTRELIRAVAEKGYTTIRVPFTVANRETVNENAGDDDVKHVIEADWLARYREVVDWCVDEGLYVIVNLHHDSKAWLNAWNGDVTDESYRRFGDYWTQLAATFADEPERVSFETINEPQFDGGSDADKQAWLDELNVAAVNIIRGTAGNETRKIILQTLDADTETAWKLEGLRDLLTGDGALAGDNNILASTHYYGDWVYSANLGRTGFDEVLFDSADGTANGEHDGATPRTRIDEFCERMDRYFTANGIGVVVGEYGLLAYDSSAYDALDADDCAGALQAGEEMKYYEYAGAMMRERGYSYVFWDNGSGIDRTSFTWNNPLVGAVLEASITGRSSTATGLDTVYWHAGPTADVAIPLTLNGNEFAGIAGLTEGKEYSYDAASSTVTLAKSYVAGLYDAKGEAGRLADLTFQFSDGADWHQYLVRWDWAYAESWRGVSGTTGGGIEIPVMFSGNEVKSVQATDSSGNTVGPNSGWWPWLQNGESFAVRYDSADRLTGTITLTPSFLGSLGDGTYSFKVLCQVVDAADSYQDTMDMTITISGGNVTLVHEE
ncbi:cellulase family glycosylhydrolase [Bifidobacterium choloepi]|nr:cellulase family glycosylhydrolase [Bifidobacterium choloepi]